MFWCWCKLLGEIWRHRNTNHTNYVLPKSLWFCVKRSHFIFGFCELSEGKLKLTLFIVFIREYFKTTNYDKKSVHIPEYMHILSGSWWIKNTKGNPNASYECCNRRLRKQTWRKFEINPIPSWLVLDQRDIIRQNSFKRRGLCPVLDIKDIKAYDDDDGFWLCNLWIFVFIYLLSVLTFKSSKYNLVAFKNYLNKVSISHSYKV